MTSVVDEHPEHPHRRTFDVQRELICEWSVDGTIVFCNGAYHSYFGSTDDIIGRHLDELVEWEDGESVADTIGRFERGEGNQVVVRIYADDRVVEWTDSVIRDEHGHPAHVVSVGRDVTDTVRTKAALRHSQIELERRHREAEDALRRQVGFVAHVSHELRNPLHGILGLSEVLTKAALPTALADAAWGIHRQSTMLRRIVDDLLDLAQIELGRLRVQAESIDLQYLLNDCVVIAREDLVDGVHLRAAPVPERHRFAFADPQRARQVLGNLLSNACKYTATGSIEIAVDRGTAPSSIRISVLDTGMGVDPAETQRLFEPYERGSGNPTPGIGLGLAIAKGAAEAMGGAIGAFARHGGGRCSGSSCRWRRRRQRCPPWRPRPTTCR